ncbi:low temperature requirement protein A [Desertimonas flava]|uniref:low temperature requirement protein A n=1 Tax=Desertimonas flava TaxID=2064846 RepID=UPI001968B504|nr:low temperature requirement protein A [Desertimonas flava]
MRMTIAHPRVPMVGRNPHEPHRAATPLELLYDLTFVVAFGAAGNETAHFFAEGHWRTGIIGFGFAMFAVIWAWIQSTWFASAYDTDDWIYRLLTMLQMIGVLVLALGLPPMFESLQRGEHVDNGVMILGYVIMRVGLIALWTRVAHHDTERRRCAVIYATTLFVAQLGWIALLVADVSVAVMFSVAAVLVLIELTGPVVAERRYGVTTPWHPHHIAERYGLLTIIALGEVILGTVAALDAVVRVDGWTAQTALVGLSGVGLAFGMWWMYFIIPSGDLLHRFRERSFGWGYGHLPLFAGIAATGAGLHVAALHMEHAAHIGPVALVLTTAVPLGIYVLCLYSLYTAITRELDRFHLVLVAVTAVIIAASIVMAAAGAPLATCLVVLTLAPAVTVVGYELVGHRHRSEMLARAGVASADGEAVST